MCFSSCHCYFVFWLHAAKLNFNCIELIRPCVMTQPELSSFISSYAPVPLDHRLLPMLVYCQFLEFLPTSGPAYLSGPCLECSSTPLPGDMSFTWGGLLWFSDVNYVSCIFHTTKFSFTIRIPIWNDIYLWGCFFFFKCLSSYHAKIMSICSLLLRT